MRVETAYLQHPSAPTAILRRSSLRAPSRRHHLARPSFRRKGCLYSPVASFASLGFTADPRINVERAANNVLKDATSLLLYQEVLHVPAAQAFLKLLLALRRGDEGWKLLDAYGEFYRLMAVGCFLSWEELLLEGILTAEGNPFAEASANIGNSKSNWSKGVPASLQAAAAADLDSLQRLSVSECTLVGWVMELVADMRPQWKVAAESSLSSREVKKFPTSSGNERKTIDGISLESDKFVLQSDLGTGFSRASLLSSDQSVNNLALHRESWRRKIGGLWRWSEAVPLLQEYYAEFGIGRTASEQAFQCRGGKLLRDTSLYALRGACILSVNKEYHERLSQHFQRYISHFHTNHVLVHGPSGSGKTTLVKSVLNAFANQTKLRVVLMQKGEIKHLQAVVEELAKNWQLQFVLVVDGLQITEDWMCVEWPENVMLCGISLSREQKTDSKLSEEFSGAFGLIVTLDYMDMQNYLHSVKEMLEYNEGQGIKPAKGSRESHMDQAELWVKDRKVLSVRTAAQFVRSIL